MHPCSSKTNRCWCKYDSSSTWFTSIYSVPLWWLHTNGPLSSFSSSLYICVPCNMYICAHGKGKGLAHFRHRWGPCVWCLCVVLHWSVPPYRTSDQYLGNTTHCDPTDIPGTVSLSTEHIDTHTFSTMNVSKSFDIETQTCSQTHEN